MMIIVFFHEVLLARGHLMPQVKENHKQAQPSDTDSGPGAQRQQEQHLADHN